MGETDLETSKAEILDNMRKFLTKKLAYLYENFTCLDDYQKQLNDLTIEKLFSKLKNKCISDEEIEQTKEIIINFNNKNGEQLTQLYLKSDVLLLTCVFEKFIKVSINEFDINSLFFVSLPVSTCQSGSKYTGINLQTLQDKDLILSLGNIIRGDISSHMGDRYVKSDENEKI